MNRHPLLVGVGIAGFVLAAFVWAAAAAEPKSAEPAKEKTPMTSSHATGPFEVRLQPVGDPDTRDGSTIGRMTIDKQFHGDLEANSKGQMLSAMTQTKGSAGYVAIERVTGTLAGKKGSFVLQHNATMDRGTPSLNIIVVPDSGTDQLTGLTGSMKINIEGGKHSYEFDYAISPR